MSHFFPLNAMPRIRLAYLVQSIFIMSSLVVPFSSLRVRMDRAVPASCRILAGIALVSLASFLWPQAAKADHLCAGRYNEYTVSEVYDQTGNVVEYWCEWDDGGSDGSPQMQYFSPEQWQAFGDHLADVDAENSRERALMGQRLRQLEAGMWFLPGEEPFAGWATGPGGSTGGQTNIGSAGCSASYWTTNGAVIMTTLNGREGAAVIVYQGYGIPAPDKPAKKRIALTQSGETQTVTALVSRTGNPKRKMGSITFAVPSGSALVNSIEDVQDYTLADEKGKVYFSGKWHDGLKARDALARCLAKQ
ncbi:MAG: hypothetical protein IE933_06065 [Sphingomonadales bacterium]|nr:hypothetical protein [Sphingomonadales bacterium]